MLGLDLVSTLPYLDTRTRASRGTRGDEHPLANIRMRLPLTYLLLAAFLTALPPAILPLSTIRVTPVDRNVPRTDAATALHNFSLDEGGGGGLLDRNTSYALADTARFARASWDCGAWGTQGAVITRDANSRGARGPPRPPWPHDCIGFLPTSHCRICMGKI